MNISGFLQYLSTRTHSQETIRAYSQDLHRFEAFLKSKGLRVTQAKPSTIAEFVAHLRDHHGRTVALELSPATIARRLAVLKSFYDFLADNSDGAVRNPVDHVKRPKVNNRLPRAVEEHRLEAFVNGIESSRDLAIVLFLVYTGLRLGELCRLDRATIVTRKRRDSVGQAQYFGFGQVVGKGNKNRNFIVAPKALAALKTYIKSRKDSNPALFVSQRGTRLTPRAVQQIVAKWCRKAGLPHINVHAFRHSFATRNVNAGMSASVLQQLMGHSSPSSTEIYFRIRPERLTREYFAAMEFSNLNETV